MSRIYDKLASHRRWPRPTSITKRASRWPRTACWWWISRARRSAIRFTSRACAKLSTGPSSSYPCRAVRVRLGKQVEDGGELVRRNTGASISNPRDGLSGLSLYTGKVSRSGPKVHP